MDTSLHQMNNNLDEIDEAMSQIDVDEFFNNNVMERYRMENSFDEIDETMS